MKARRQRVALLSVYFTLFDEQMPPGFRETREQAAQRYADVLGQHFEVVYPGLVTSDAEGERTNEVFRSQPLEAVVFAPSMAAPPSYGLRAVDGIDAPMVIWNAPLISRLDADLTQAGATANTTQVGCVMLANALVRQDRRFVALTAAPDDTEATGNLLRSVRAAAAASALRGSAALRLGDPVAGYADVEATSEELAGLGVEERELPVEELNEAFRGVPEEEVRRVLSQLAARGWQVSPGSERGARLAVALSNLFGRHGAACGTVNCHGPYFRWNPEVGITACLGVSLLTERGIPISCTGDQPTALALSLARALSGRALYCEFYAPELETGLMLLAAGGEGDPGWADPAEPVRVEPNQHYPGAHGAGASVAFRLEPGPATVLSFSPVPGGWRLVWATGEIVETRYGRMGGPNAMFRFDSGPSGEASTRWIESGATHHNAVAAGRLDVEVPVLARFLGVEAVRV